MSYPFSTGYLPNLLYALTHLCGGSFLLGKNENHVEKRRGCIIAQFNILITQRQENIFLPHYYPDIPIAETRASPFNPFRRDV